MPLLLAAIRQPDPTVIQQWDAQPLGITGWQPLLPQLRGAPAIPWQRFRSILAALPVMQPGPRTASAAPAVRSHTKPDPTQVHVGWAVEQVMGGALERAAARVCREAGARVTTHTLLSDSTTAALRLSHSQLHTIAPWGPTRSRYHVGVPPHQRWATPTAAWGLRRVARSQRRLPAPYGTMFGKYCLCEDLNTALTCRNMDDTHGKLMWKVSQVQTRIA